MKSISPIISVENQTISFEDLCFSSAKDELMKWTPGKLANEDSTIQVIDLFSGCGGMSLGFAALSRAMGDIQIIGAVDLNDKSLATYNHNFDVPAISCDIRELAASNEKLNNFLDNLDGYNPDKTQILIGCAPCQGFTAHRKKNWDKPDVRNGLIESFTDIAVKLSPDCIVMENVPELLSKKYWHHFKYFQEKMSESGYVVKQTIHNAATQGVPQERFRAIIIAMKQDFYLPSERYHYSEFKTVRDAIGNLEPVKAGQSCVKDKLHKSANHKASTIDVIKAIPINGGSRPPGVGPKCLQNFKGYADVYGRLSWDKPSITITHYARNPASGRFVHPEQHRGLSMREAARLQSFPDGFEFVGNSDDVYRQIGEAVPPLMAAAIASNIFANLKKQSQPTIENIITEPVNNSYAGVIAGMKVARV